MKKPTKLQKAATQLTDRFIKQLRDKAAVLHINPQTLLDEVAGEMSAAMFLSEEGELKTAAFASRLTRN